MLFSKTYSQVIKSFINDKEETLKSFLEKEGLLDNLTAIRELLCYDSLTQEEASHKVELNETSNTEHEMKLDGENNSIEVGKDFEGKPCLLCLF